MLSLRSSFGSKPGSPSADTAVASRITGRSVVALAFTQPSYQRSKDGGWRPLSQEGKENVSGQDVGTHSQSLHPVPSREPGALIEETTERTYLIPPDDTTNSLRR